MTMRASVFITVLVLALAGASARRDLTASFSTGGTCKATGIAGKDAFVTDAWVSAVSKVVIRGCSVDAADSGKIVIRGFVSDFADWAKAAVDVYAFAFSKCTTLDGTTGCAAALAHAEKWAAAHAVGYAKAVARAANKCAGCDPVVLGSLTSNLIVEITAAAKARVSTGVCITGDGKAVEKARIECWAQTTATIAATSLAKALIKGSCLDLTAHIKVETYINASTDDGLCACEGWVSTGDGRAVWQPRNERRSGCAFHARSKEL